MKKEIKLKTGTRKTSVSRAKVSEVIQDIKDMAWTEEKVHRFNEYKPLTHVEVKSTKKQRDLLEEIKQYKAAKDKIEAEERKEEVIKSLKSVKAAVRKKGKYNMCTGCMEECLQIIQDAIKEKKA